MALRTAHLGLLGFRESAYPQVWTWPPTRIAMSIHETAVEKFYQPGMQGLDS